MVNSNNVEFLESMFMQRLLPGVLVFLCSVLVCVCVCVWVQRGQCTGPVSCCFLPAGVDTIRGPPHPHQPVPPGDDSVVLQKGA